MVQRHTACTDSAYYYWQIGINKYHFHQNDVNSVCTNDRTNNKPTEKTVSRLKGAMLRPIATSKLTRRKRKIFLYAEYLVDEYFERRTNF